ncbi:MAG TPA: SPFH domain-containing protein [Clostridiales bacterium]|nr:SPFH domain-containing protein [Clostridiales bacterium]HQP69660.1 SPFH domain-containing protein [Clostridiales bacterium]
MGLMDKIINKAKAEFIDIIEWLDQTDNTLAYRFERYQNEIKNGAKLTVREGQMAVFVNEGQIADVFKPGMYTLTTENLPILATLKGWKYGFNSPFKAEVYFLSTRNITDQKWGTKNAIMLSDDRFGMIEIRAYGTYVMRVKDGPVFIREIVGTDGNFTAEKINEQLKSLIVARFTDAVGEAKIPIEKYAADINETSETVFKIISPEFDKYGIEVTKFIIENISMPDEIKKEIFELSRLDKIDLDKLTKLKTAKAIEVAAANPNGTAGAGMGMGMGFAMANQMGQSMAANQARPASAPPPVPPALQFFIVFNGAQDGPHDMNGLKNLVLQNKLNRDTLVWREGMSSWTAAKDVPELNSVLGSVPPPIPGM